ncbi:hypothetical protein [Leptolyngbya sp. KIOST-1]|uniref:hypothetical protein n=1 Tax=Leptolyngbya sp. KIOST-1 TaxID=1229172 RepID=UPI00055C0749|nr:hypothetical protein [Leptolyngbya sp. KIOST-1]
MTELLEKAIAQVKNLPAEEQDAIAAIILAELEDEQVWKAQFESTTDDQWDRMAKMARQKITAGELKSLNDVSNR